MYSIPLSWKAFSLNLADVETWLRANAGVSYVGNSADSQFTLWFSEEPAQAVKDAIANFWDALIAESPEAFNYVSMASIRAAIDVLKAGIPAKTWDQMTVAERKLVLGQMPTNAELGL